MKTSFRTLLFLLWLIPLISTAQTESVDLQVIEMIRHEGFNNSAIQETAIHLVDGIGPRLSGSTQLTKANEWAKQQLEEWGLSNVRIEPWGEFGTGWENEKFYIAMTKPYYQPLVAVPQAWSGSTSGLIKAEVVVIDIRNPEDFETYRGTLRDKVVTSPVQRELELSFNPLASRFTTEQLDELRQLPEASDRMRRNVRDWAAMRELARNINEFLREEGVAAIINSSGSFGIVRSGGVSRTLTGHPPQIDMTYEHHARMVRLLERGIPVEIELEVRNRFLEQDLMGYNVIGEIPGTDKELKDQVVMVGAHLDTWHVGGGNDNGAGVVVMMEVMRILKTLGIDPRRTIKIGLWGSEEQGLLGARGYVRDYLYDQSEDIRKPGFDKFSAYYNIDYGSGKIRGVYTMENDALAPVFEAWIKPLEDLGVTIVSPRSSGGSDHGAFNSAGLVGLPFIQDRLDYGRGYHTNMDTFERMSLEDMKQIAVVVATFVYHTAQRDELLPRKPAENL
jgi:carboxypeptidase Q